MSGMINAHYKQRLLDDGRVVSWLRGVHVTRSLAERVDQFPMPGGAHAVLVHDPETDTVEDVAAPLGFTQAKGAFQERR